MGGGDQARVISVDRAVATVGRRVAEEERLATAKARVLHLLQTRPGLSLRAVSAGGGDARAIRRAVALMLRDGTLRETDPEA